MRFFPPAARAFSVHFLFAASMLLGGCAGARPKSPAPTPAPTTPSRAAGSGSLGQPSQATGVMLGIDVLEQQDFAGLRGKRVGLLTHPAAVNRFGVPTVDVMFRDKRLNLVALFAVEHGIYGDIPAGQHFEDQTDRRTGLPVHSLYTGRTRKPTQEQLKNIDVLVIDLQDIGSRSYTFVGAMRLAIEACFENKKRVVVLDRPNPLGGLKVSGPPLDPNWVNYLAPLPTPYVHGMTIGELARMAVSEPGMLQIPDSVRKKGHITVIPMRGWTRSMTWPDTGLRWVPTSPNIPDFAAVVGYPMTGLGAQLGGFRHGIGTPHPFRLLTHPAMSQSDLAAELTRRGIPGLRFQPVNLTLPPLPNAKSPAPRPIAGVFVEVSDWNSWRPTELSLHMMQIAAARAAPKNPFAAASKADAELFNKHTGSTAFWNTLTRDAARLNVAAIFADWQRQADAFQQRTQKYRLYR